MSDELQLVYLLSEKGHELISWLIHLSEHPEQHFQGKGRRRTVVWGEFTTEKLSCLPCCKRIFPVQMGTWKKRHVQKILVFRNDVTLSTHACTACISVKAIRGTKGLKNTSRVNLLYGIFAKLFI